MKQKIYQVDAFTNKVFSGNPAAVCPLEKWLPDELMQQIAMENNLAETAFYVRQGDRFEIRWFTPTVEVDLCGHATLAAAFVLFNHEGYRHDQIEFYSPRSGVLRVTKKESMFTLNFPSDTFEALAITEEIADCFNIRPTAAFKGKTDYLLIFENEEQVKNISVAMHKLAALNARGVIISARGEEADFVSRFFAPQSGIDEDPVTGSAHTTLTPYWAKQLGKTDMKAVQLSARGGFLNCKYLGERVEISGEAKLYLAGDIHLY